MGQLPSNCTLSSYCAVYTAICGDLNGGDDTKNEGNMDQKDRKESFNLDIEDEMIPISQPVLFSKPYWITTQAAKSSSPTTLTEVTCHHAASNKLMAVDVRDKETLCTAPPGYSENAGWLIEYEQEATDGQEHPIIRLKNAHSQQYINILQDGSVVCNDRTGTKEAVFRVHRLPTGLGKARSRYQFESVEFANKFLCMSEGRVVVGGKEDRNCEFDVFCSTEQTPLSAPADDEHGQQEDSNAWIESLLDLSTFLEQKQNQSDDLCTELPLTATFWKSVNSKKAANMDAILTALQEFIGSSNFGSRLSLWEKVDSKKGQLSTATALPKLLYQTMLEYMNQKDKKREKPKWNQVESFMNYLAEHIEQMDTFSEKHKEQLTKEEFARNLDNWMTAVTERYKQH